MGTIRVIPVVQSVTACNTYAVSQVGDPSTIWGDSDDATYVEMWRDATSGGSARGVTPIQSAVTLDAATLYLRAELMIAGNATGNGNVVSADAYRDSDGHYLGSWLPATQPSAIGAVFEITDWTWSEAYAGSLADLGAALPNGLRIDLSRSSSENVPPSYGYGMRAFEFNLYLTTSPSAVQAYNAPLRLYPREDGLGVGTGQLYPPPRSVQYGARIVGGYL